MDRQLPGLLEVELIVKFHRKLIVQPGANAQP